MPKKFPREFKRDVVKVARRGDAPRAQVAADFGISDSTLKRWMAQADIDDGNAEGIPVNLVCEVLGFSRQAFYEWEKQQCSNRDLDDAYVTNALVDAHAEDPEFGYRFLADADTRLTGLTSVSAELVGGMCTAVCGCDLVP